MATKRGFFSWMKYDLRTRGPEIPLIDIIDLYVFNRWKIDWIKYFKDDFATWLQKERR